MKRIISILVTCVMLFSLFGTFSLNASAVTYSGTWGDLTWTLDTESGELVISGEGEMEDFADSSTDAWLNYKGAIESVVINNGVTSIGDNAFSLCSGVTNITIPKSVTNIGSGAFIHCSLTNLTIPSGVKSIEEFAFQNCQRLTNITIPNNVTSIGKYAFSYCRILSDVTILDGITRIEDGVFADCDILTSINIPNSVTSIGYFAFSNCTSLTSIVIPDSVTSIGDYAFYNCSVLTNITLDENNIYYESIDGNLYDKEGKTLIQYAIGKTENSFTVPDGVTSIYKCAFKGCINLTNITIDDSVTSLGEDSFSHCLKLETITYLGTEEQWSNISKGTAWDINCGYSTQKGTYTLEFKGTTPEPEFDYSGTWGDLTWTLDANTGELLISGEGEMEDFSTSSLTAAWKNHKKLIKSVVINEGVTSIGNQAFLSNDLFSPFAITSVSIPNSVTSIGEEAFCHCDVLTSITIPNNVTSIGKKAFYNCDGLTSITIPNSVTSIGEEAFMDCTNLTNVILSNRMVVIEPRTFSSCLNLTGINIPNSVEEIGRFAFYKCENLLSVTLPNNISSIGDYAFDLCYRLVEIINLSDLPIENAARYDYGYIANYALEVHTGESKIVDKDGYFFYTYDDTNYLIGLKGNAISEKTLFLPENYNGETYKINDYALYGSYLTKYSVQDNLTNIVISDGVTDIGNHAFAGRYNLVSVTVSSSVTSIGGFAFSECVNLVEIINLSELPLESVESSELYKYGYITKYAIEVHNGKSKIVDKDGFLFYTHNNTNYLIGYSGTESQLVLPKDYNGNKYEIYKYAFAFDKELRSVIIPNNITNIGEYAFYGCEKWRLASNNLYYDSGLTSVTIGNGVTSIRERTFYDCMGLTSITIPESITSIENYAFDSPNLTNIKYYGTESSWNKITIGSGNDTLLNATRNYIYGSETFNSASVRISSEHPGLRFKTAIEQDVLDELIELYGKENIKIGTIIIPEDMVTELDMVTVEALEAAGINFVRVWADIDQPFTTNGTTNIYAGSLTNIKEANLDRDFIGVGYIEITKENGEVLYYYSSTTATRNVSYIASRAIGDTSETQVNEYKYEMVVDDKVCYSPYTEAQREILDKLIVKK